MKKHFVQLVGTICVISCTLRLAGDDGVPSPASAVIKAWRGREADWAHAKWTSTILIPRGALGVAIPAEDLSIHETAALALGRDKWRFDTRGQTFDSNEKRLVPEESKNSYQAGELRSWRPNGLNGYPIANISDGTFTNIPQPDWHKAGFLALCPLRSGIVVEASLKAAGAGVVGNAQCIVLEQVVTERGSLRLWVDANQPFLLRRFATFSRGKLGMTCDLIYEGTKQHPYRWHTTIVAGDGRLIHAITTNVQQLSVAAPLPPRQFNIEFPPRTVVQDHREKARRAGKLFSLILADGRQQDITGDPRVAHSKAFAK